MKLATMIAVLVTLLLAGTASLVPTTRQWMVHEAARFTTVQSPSKGSLGETVVAVSHEPVAAPPAAAGPDLRFSASPAAQSPAAPSRVVPGGLIGLEPQDAPPEAFRLEHAALAVATPDMAVPMTPTVSADFANAQQAIALYRKGSVAAGDEFAKPVADPLLRATVEWVALKFDPREAGIQRLKAFAADHPDWAALPWIKRRIEEMSVSGLHDPAAVTAYFTGGAPRTLYGRLALARAEIAQGDLLGGVARVRAIWRLEDISATEEADILREFGPVLGRADHKFRADRLLYKEQVGPAMRAAVLAGPDIKLLAQARAAVIGQGSTAT